MSNYPRLDANAQMRADYRKDTAKGHQLNALRDVVRDLLDDYEGHRQMEPALRAVLLAAEDEQARLVRRWD